MNRVMGLCESSHATLKVQKRCFVSPDSSHDSKITYLNHAPANALKTDFLSLDLSHDVCK
jgi:hypothetical protein